MAPAGDRTASGDGGVLLSLGAVRRSRARPVRRVALLSVNPWDVPGPFQPFSYAIHRIDAALAVALPDVELRVFDRGRHAVERWVEEIDAFAPDVVAGSAYVWSLPTLLAIARALATRSERPAFVLGGPSARPAMLSLPPYREVRHTLDALVVREGEQAIVEVVRTLSRDGDLARVAGLALPTRDGWHHTPPAPRLDLSALPSPYQLGRVPRGVTAHLETFRGCPLACAFCQWGEMSAAKRDVMSVAALAAELRSFRQLGIDTALITDAALNLNAQAFRNLLAADDQAGFFDGAFVECEVYPTKLSRDHWRFLERTRAAVGVGLQSTIKGVLDSMLRIAPRDFAGFVRRLSSKAEVTIELILGLPGDSPEGFLRSLDFALELGCNVRVFHCLVLPDALMTRRPEHLEIDFHPITLEVRSATGWTQDALLACVERVRRHSSGGAPSLDAEASIDAFAGRPVMCAGWTLPAI